MQLALLTGALGIGSQLWKIHATGVYVTWYLGFLLLGFLGHQLKETMTVEVEKPRQVTTR